MRTFPLFSIAVAIGWFSFAGSLGAEVPSAAGEVAPIATDEMERLAAEMDADRFAQRQAAAQRLGEMGSAAFPTLEKAVTSPSREASARALEILKKHLEGGDEATQAAAKESLERLAKSGNAAVARRVGEVLNPPQSLPLVRPVNAARILRPPVVLPLNRIQVGNARRVTIRNINGVKQVEAEEGGRKVKYVDDPAKGIEMEVTEGGKTEKYSAKDAAELKQKHPAAHKIYEQYGQGANGIRIQVGGAAAPPAIPLPAAPKAMEALHKQKLIQHYDKVIESMEKTIQSYRQHDNDSARRVIENLEKIKRQYQEKRDRMAAG